MHIFISSKERKSVQWATIFKYARMKDKCAGNKFCRKWYKRQTHKEMDVKNVTSIKLWHLVNWMLTESFENNRATPSSPLFVDRIVDWMADIHPVVTERIRRPPDLDCWQDILILILSVRSMPLILTKKYRSGHFKRNCATLPIDALDDDAHYMTTVTLNFQINSLFLVNL